MFKKFGTCLNNMKLNRKLFLIYIVIGVIPIMLMMFSSINLMTSILRDNEQKSTQVNLNQVAYSVDSKLIAYNSLSDYIVYNDTIAKILTSDYEDMYELYTQIVSVIKPQLETAKYFGDSVKRVTIYADVKKVKYDDFLIPLSEIKKEEWYKEMYQNVSAHWYVNEQEKSVFCVRRMAKMRTQKKMGVLYVEIDYEKLFELLSYNMVQNYGIFVTDENGQSIYSDGEFQEGYEKYELTYDEFLSIKENVDDSDYTVLYADLEEAPWRIWLYQPDETIVNDTKPIKTLVYIVVFIAAITLLLGLMWVSRFITRRISYLKKGMEAAEEGDFSIRLEAEDKDEIGEVIRGYNTLLGKIQTLIEEVYESEIAQKKYEMRALQSQINPHFLYNSLSLINWKAIECENKDISDITLSLSNFYRTSLNKGKNTLSLEKEISNVRSYIDIQLIMHDQDFDVEYDIDDTILKYETLNLILQPIVENAIEHGIDVKTDGERGKIKIEAFREEEKIYIRITDNGVGMDDEKAQSILSQNSKGYGIRNVNQRIQLYYGQEYSLNIKSKINEGTCITVCIPVIEMEDG